MKKRSIFKCIFTFLLGFILVFQLNSGFAAEVITPTGITLNKESIELFEGDEEQLIPSIKPSNATNNELKWTSSNESIVTVDPNGLLKAVSKGNATIIVATREGGYTDICTVVVKENVSVKGVTLNKHNITLVVGGAEKLTAVLNPADAKNKEVQWKSSNESIAVVDQTGIVRGISEGLIAVVVVTKEGSYIDTCTVKVSKNILPQDGYKTWSKQNKEVSPTKEWKIKFSRGVDITSLVSNIAIVDKNSGQLFDMDPSDMSLSFDNKVLTIGHKNPFESGKEYILYINKEVKEYNSNTTLKNGIMMSFTVSN